MKRPLLLFLALLTCLAFAHPGSGPSAVLKVREDRTFELRVRFDLVAFASGQAPGRVSETSLDAFFEASPKQLESALAEAKSRFAKGLKINGKTPIVIQSLSFPTASELQAKAESHKAHRHSPLMTVVATGRLPESVKAISVSLPRSLGELVFRVELPYQEPAEDQLRPGASLRQITLPTRQEVAAAKALAFGKR
jgi:hypothetical protein